MAKKWAEVASSPAYRALSNSDKEAARSQYFDQVVAPQVGSNDLSLARAQFDAQTATRAPDVPLASTQQRYTDDQLMPDAMAPQREVSPTNGLGTDLENVEAGAGKQVIDGIRGAQQIGSGLVSVLPGSIGRLAADKYASLKAEQSEANRLDAPLMETKAGLAGAILGQAGLAVTGGTALKGANLAASVVPSGYAGTALTGAALGAAQPISTEQGELGRAFNAGAGLAGGVAGRGLVGAAGAGVRGVRALIDPLTETGQGRIVGNALSRFADGEITPTPSAIPGVQATMAEATGSPGLAQLQRAITDSDPAITSQFVEQASNNNGARLAYLQSIAGTPEDVANAKAWRDQVANAKYGQAFADSNSQQVARQSNAAAQLAQGEREADAKYWRDEAADALSSAQDAARKTMAPSAKMQDLAKRPIIQNAAKQAKTIAANAGIDIGDPMSSLQGQHYIKMALDDALNTAPQMGIGKTEQAAIASAKREFVTELERQNPSYKEARDAYRTMSAPANRLEIAQGLVSQLTKNPVDIDTLGNQNIRPDAFGRAVGQLDSITRKLTGQNQAVADDYLNDQQKQGISALVGDLSRLKTATNVGRSAGSNTVQNLASQNALSEVTRGLGAPGLADSKLLQRVTNPINTAYKLLGVPQQLQEKLAQVMLDPTSAESRAILASIPKEDRQLIEARLAPVFGLVGQSTGLGVSQQAALKP